VQTSPSASPSRRNSYQHRGSAPRLTAPGLVILQSALIALALALELLIRNKVAAVTGVTVLVAFAGGVLFARPKIALLAAIVPPLASFAALIVLLPTLGSSAFSPTRLALDLSASLANLAPYLLIGALGAWGIALYRRS